MKREMLMDAKLEILKLKDGESWIWPESDYGKAEIWYKNETYSLFEIPLYGGQPVYSRSFYENNIDELILKVNSWT